MATRLVNLKQGLESQIIPNRNRYAVGSEERAKFDDLLSRLRNAENEIEFQEVYNDFKTLTGRSDLVDIDSLREKNVETRTGNGYQGPADELYSKLQQVDFLINRGNEEIGINEVQSYVDSAERILEELKNNGLNQDVITRFSDRLIPIKEKLENLRKTNGTSEVPSSETVEFESVFDNDNPTSAASEEFVEPVSIETEQETELQKLDAATEELENLRVSAGQTTNPEELRNIQERAQSIYNSAFSTFSRNDDNDTLEQIASEHLETINSNLEIAQATQKFDEQTAEIEDLRVKAMNTSDARELNDIRDRAQSIYTQNFPNNSNNESEQVYSDIAREHVEQISEMARTAESIAANAVEEEEIQPQNIDYDNPLSESIEINDTPSAPDAPAAPESPTDAPAEPEIFMGSIDSDAFDLDEVVQDEPEVVIDNNAPTAESIETNDIPSAPDAPSEPIAPVTPDEPENTSSINNDDFEIGIGENDFENEPEIIEEDKKDIENDDFEIGIGENDFENEPEIIEEDKKDIENDDFEIGIGENDFENEPEVVEDKKGVENDDFEIGIGENDFENEEEVIDSPDIEKDFKEVFGKEKSDTVKITIYNGKHQETFLIPRGTNFKEPLPAIPVNKNGKPKKLTAKEFDGWLDAYGNEMEFPVVINDDFEIHASYKFDKKKALAVAAGAAVGGLAYVADLALPTPVPVISTVGSIGFKLGARAVNKKLANIQKLTNEHRKFTAQKIQDIQEPSPELLTLLETEKSLGHWKTFLNTAAIACGISAAAHGIKNTMDAKTQIIEEPVQPEPIVNEPIVQEPIIQPEPQQVLGEFDPTIGKVYKTANSALSGTGAGNPYMPAYQGQEIYQAFFNGNRVMIQPGQSIESILQSVGASDISEVAVNVMNANGTPLTWQPLEALVEGISQVR